MDIQRNYHASVKKKAVSICISRTRTHHSYTTHTVSWRGGGGGGAERVRWAGERAILVVVTQCLLLLTRTHHSHTTHTVSWRGGRWGVGGGGVRGGEGGGGVLGKG